MKRVSTWRALLSVLRSIFILLLGAGCSATHGPESADTATSWLRACVSDDECSGASRCVEHLCAISCADGQSSCALMAPRARCEQPRGASESVCDLPCDSDAACAAVGNGYICQEGHCRPRSALELASQRLTLLDPSPEDEVWPATPLAAWMGDRFRVAIVGGNSAERYANAVLEVSELFPDGTLLSQPPPASPRPEGAAGLIGGQSLGINGAGTIARGFFSTDSLGLEPVALDLVQFLVPDGRVRRTLECARVFGVAPVPRSNDWLVLCKEDGAASLGRYDPVAEHWSSPLRRVAEGLGTNQRVELSVQGKDALLWQRSTTWQRSEPRGRVARIPDAAGDRAQLSEEPVEWHVLATEFLQATEDGFVSGELSGDWLVPRWIGLSIGDNVVVSAPALPMQTLIAFHLQESGAPSEPVRFQLSRAHMTQLYAVLGLPERRQIAFCFEERSLGEGGGTWPQGLFVSLFDERGNRTGGPHRLNGASTQGGCRLAWSGSGLLATWVERDGAADVPADVHARAFWVR